MRKKIITIARTCKHEFMIYPGDLKRGKDNFCSRKCYYKSTKGRQVVPHGTAPWNKGKKGVYTKETINNMRMTRKGKNTGEKHPMWGRKLSLEERIKLSLAHQKVDVWIGFTTTERKRDMRTRRYIDWRISVFERDNYTCQECGIRGGTLNADHIKPYVAYPEVRYDINNGRTLCVDCHRKTSTWGFKNIKRDERGSSYV